MNSNIERGAKRAVVCNCNDIIVEKRALMYVLTSFQLKASILYIMASQGKQFICKKENLGIYNIELYIQGSTIIS